MAGHQQYSPISPIDETSHHDSDRTSQESRESIELKNIQRSEDPATPFNNQKSKKSSPPPNSKVFNSKKQTWKLFFPQFFRWLGTVIFVAFILATLKIFENQGNFSNNSKHLFNTIITALGLGLGLNFFVSLGVRVRFRVTDVEIFCVGSIQRYSQGFPMADIGKQGTQRSRGGSDIEHRESV